MFLYAKSNYFYSINFPQVGKVLLSSASPDSRAQLILAPPPSSLATAAVNEDEENGNNSSSSRNNSNNAGETDEDARQRALRRWEQIKDIYDRR